MDRLFHFGVLRKHCSNIFKSADVHLSVLHFSVPSSQGLMRVKWNFVLILALASNNLSVSSPQGPTEG